MSTMNLQAILHIPKSNYAYPVSGLDFRVRLRAGRGDLDSVRLVIGNQYLWETREEFPMEKLGSDGLFDYYQYEYHCTDTRLGYYFLLKKGEEELIYTENGFLEPGSVDIDHDRIGFVHFQFPFINGIDVHKKPSWVNSAVFYQIFPERFCNGDPSLSPETVCQWGGKPDRMNFFGGDLPGVIQKLPYLSELGVNALYLTPIFEASTNHKYDTNDDPRIDPHFGDESTLVELVQKAHERGIRIMLDGVFNHCGFFFRQFQDVLKHGEKSPYRDWFHIKSFPVTLDPPNFDGFAIGPYMPKFNTENQEVMEYLLGAVAKWTRTGIDGWRLDVADEVDAHFWREFRKTVRGINPDAVIIGENWWNAEPWLRGDQFDGVMNYAVQRASVLYFAEDRIGPKKFEESLTENLVRYTDQANDCMLNLLDSHDTARFLNTCGGEAGRLKNAAVFQYTFVGMPCTYYGTEIGMTGGNDPDCRRTFDWEESHWNRELFEFYQKLMALRKGQKALQYGTVRFCSAGEVFAMERSCGEDTLVTVVNNTDGEQEFVLPGNRALDLLSGAGYTGEAGKIRLKLPAFSSVILKKETVQ